MYIVNIEISIFLTNICSSSLLPDKCLSEVRCAHETFLGQQNVSRNEVCVISNERHLRNDVHAHKHTHLHTHTFALSESRSAMLSPPKITHRFSMKCAD
jgi:hypothetical protein